MFNLGLMLDQGRGGPPDPEGAVDLYIRAAQASLPDAMHALCEVLLDGRGVAPDPEKAAGWCHAAAAQGHPPAQMLLATLYALGRGIAVDEARAVAWLSIAAAQGYPPAVKARDDMLPRLTAEIRSRAAEIAAELGAGALR